MTRLDRLARSTLDLLNVLDTMKRQGAGFKSLADAWADTTTPHGKLMLTVLGGLAEFERTLISDRTSEGRKRAKARGVHMGARLLSISTSDFRRYSGKRQARQSPKSHAATMFIAARFQG